MKNLALDLVSAFIFAAACYAIVYRGEWKGITAYHVIGFSVIALLEMFSGYRRRRKLAKGQQ